MTASDVDVAQCAVGAASKDGSLLRIRNATILEASIAGLMSYTKKPEYGGASLVAENVAIKTSARPTWVEHGNDLRFDGKPLATEDIDVDALYRSSMQRGDWR